MAGRQRRLAARYVGGKILLVLVGEHGRIPRGHDVAAAVGVFLDAAHHFGDLVDALAVPIAPLGAIDRTEVTLRVGPFVPDADLMVVQVPDVGVAAEHPQQLVDDGLQVHLLGGDQREALLEVETHLVAEHADGARARAVAFLHAVVEDVLEQVEVLLHERRGLSRGRLGFFGGVFVFEQDRKQDAHHQGEGGEYVPSRRPSVHHVEARVGSGGVEHETVHHRLGAERTDGGAEAVGHHHEHALGAAADLLVGILVDEQGAADVEEVESHAVDDHGEDQQHEAEAGGVARAEEEEAERPGHKGDEHHLLDAELLQEEGDQQDTQGLRDLRDRGEEHVVLHREGVGILRVGAESVEVRRGEAVGHLQAHAQQEREDEEHAHLAVLEQGEGAQAEGVDKRGTLGGLVDRAVGQREGIHGQDQAPGGRNEQLHVVVLEAGEVDDPHGEDESDGAEDPDGGEGLHGIQAGLVQGVVRHGVAQCDGRHEEGHAQGIIGEDLPEGDLIAVFHAHVTRQCHEHGGQEMTDAEHLLRRHPAVGDDADQGGHEQRHDALDGEELSDVGTHADAAQIDAKRTEISSPNGKDQEVHHDQSEFDSFHIERFKDSKI